MFASRIGLGIRPVDLIVVNGQIEDARILAVLHELILSASTEDLPARYRARFAVLCRRHIGPVEMHVAVKRQFLGKRYRNQNVCRFNDFIASDDTPVY